MKRYLVLGAWLTVVWVGLWGDLSWANLLSGLVIAAFVIVLWAPREALGFRLRPVALVRFLGYFTVSLLRASLQVSREVLRLNPQIREAVIAAPIRSTTRGMTAVIAAAISLTPGTLVIDSATDGSTTTLYIHVFDLVDRDTLLANVARLEQLAVAALSPTVPNGSPPETEGLR